MVRISVIAWDGGFRESCRALDFFAHQSLPHEAYEFIWVEYYHEAAARLTARVTRLQNTQVICLGGEGHWHAGRCINAGIAASTGDVLVIVDGDVAVKPDFLERIQEAHAGNDRLVLYVRRWDEPPSSHLSHGSIEHLEAACRLGNPTNYGGCLSLRWDTMALVGGYENHPVFGGPGAVSKELYTRLVNAGLPIMWHPVLKAFHPWHAGSLPSTDTPRQRRQAHTVRQRSLNLATQASEAQVEQYLADYSELSGGLRNVIIMGSGRSGTSLTAGLLAGTGYFMGDHLNPANETNPKGQFEDREINGINEELLAQITPGRPPLLGRWLFRHRPVQWQRWLARVPVGTPLAVAPAMSERMGRFVQREPYCFKDPRFSYTLPAWRPLLKQGTAFVCVFRDPAVTAQSIRKQACFAQHLNNFSINFTRAVEVWTLMYRHILEIHRHRGDWLFLHYRQILGGEGLDRLEAFTGAMVDRSFPDASLRRSSSNRPVSGEARAVYQQLCELAGFIDEE
jgi:hypothetical protein